VKKIGFIGLGIMGKPMCKNLLKAGYQIVVFTRKRAVAEELVALGASAANSPRDVAARSEAVITMLPDSPDVEDVVLGKDGVIEGASRGSVLIDMSSIAPLVSREVGRRLAERGIEMLDAPVSGGEPRAIDGTLSVMVGGKPAVFDACHDVMKAMAASVVRVGDLGAGSVAKLANQIIVAINIAAVSEALVLATKAGVAPEDVHGAIRGGLAGSAVLEAKGPLMLDRKFQPGFRLNLHIKDLANVLATSHGLAVPLPLTAAVMEMMQALKAADLGDRDHSALVMHYESLAGVEVRRSLES
jgi:2-hydroxy-3-oxopropionate reductase